MKKDSVKTASEMTIRSSTTTESLEPLQKSTNSSSLVPSKTEPHGKKNWSKQISKHRKLHSEHDIDNWSLVLRNQDGSKEIYDNVKTDTEERAPLLFGRQSVSRLFTYLIDLPNSQHRKLVFTWVEVIIFIHLLMMINGYIWF